MIKALTLLATLTVLLSTSTLFAQSPANLISDVAWSGSYNTTSDIEGAFNNGRRQEEQQLGLTNGILGDIVLPSNWDDFDDAQKALFLVNEERTARGGVDYGDGPCLGLALEGLESNLTGLATDHMNWLIANNQFSHTGENGLDPFARIDNDPVLGAAAGCHQFLPRAENLAGFWTSTSTVPMVIERAIYGWIYENSSSAWGHRQGILLQDLDLFGNPWGYTNDKGQVVTEGYMGIGVATATGGTYDPFNIGGWVNGAGLAVMTIIDPVNTGTCAYNMPAPAPGVLPVELIDFNATLKLLSLRQTVPGIVPNKFEV